MAREAAGEDGEVVVSIFVNPLQFEPGSDYKRYPRPEKADEEFCRDAGVDLLFRPSAEEIYANDRSTFVEETSLSARSKANRGPDTSAGFAQWSRSCSTSSRLMRLCSAKKIFSNWRLFGGWFAISISRFDIIAVPIVREEDGLACSSRNQYLNPEERKQAAVLYKALMAAKGAGKKSVNDVVALAQTVINEAHLARIDYVEVADAETLKPIEIAGPNSVLLLAVSFGKTRLIDNIRLA